MLRIKRNLTDAKSSEVEVVKSRRLWRPRNIFLSIVALSIVSAVAGVLILRQQLAIPNVQLPTLNGLNTGVAFYDRKDQYICTVHADRDREIVPLERISPNMRKAILAAEDRRFYNHIGLDVWGIGRAAWTNHRAGRTVEGASTITQQLVRNLYLDKNDRSMTRKLREAFLALDVEQRYSKAKILESYLNEAYFGGGVYGIERAAQHYFNKHANALTVPESAFLAGLVKSPSTFGDPAHRSAAIGRQHVILDKMVECEMLTQKQAEQAKRTTLAFNPGPPQMLYPHYLGYALQSLQKQMGDDLWKSKWKAYTNLDREAQQVAEETLERGIKNAPYGVNQGALVTISVADGALLAMVGGSGPDSQWNRCLYPHTAGSAFKPFVYLAGITQGLLWPDTLINDAELKVENPGSTAYNPKNFDGKFMGWLPAGKALAVSRNVCAVRIAQQVGISRVIELAHAAGIKSQLDAYPSTALGSCAVTPLEMATAYATLARKGAYMEPLPVRRIESADGRNFKTFQSPTSVNLEQESVAELVESLQDVVRCGTGSLAALPGIPVAGKTGTADKAKDLWFVGFTPDTVTAVWGGNDKNHEVHGGHSVTGGAVMARIWHDYMSQFYRINPPKTRLAFDRPAYKLAITNPKIDEAWLVANRDPYAQKPGDSSIRCTIGADGAIDTEKVKQFGFVRAFDWQRTEFLNRLANVGTQADTMQQAEAVDANGMPVQAVAEMHPRITEYPAGRTQTIVQQYPQPTSQPQQQYPQTAYQAQQRYPQATYQQQQQLSQYVPTATQHPQYQQALPVPSQTSATSVTYSRVANNVMPQPAAAHGARYENRQLAERPSMSIQYANTTQTNADDPTESKSAPQPAPDPWVQHGVTPDVPM